MNYPLLFIFRECVTCNHIALVFHNENELAQYAIDQLFDYEKVTFLSTHIGLGGHKLYELSDENLDKFVKEFNKLDDKVIADAMIGIFTKSSETSYLITNHEELEAMKINELASDECWQEIDYFEQLI